MAHFATIICTEEFQLLWQTKNLFTKTVSKYYDEAWEVLFPDLFFFFFFFLLLLFCWFAPFRATLKSMASLVLFGLELKYQGKKEILP